MLPAHVRLCSLPRVGGGVVIAAQDKPSKRRGARVAAAGACRASLCIPAAMAAVEAAQEDAQPLQGEVGGEGEGEGEEEGCVSVAALAHALDSMSTRAGLLRYLRGGPLENTDDVASDVAYRRDLVGAALHTYLTSPSQLAAQMKGCTPAECIRALSVLPRPETAAQREAAAAVWTRAGYPVCAMHVLAQEHVPSPDALASPGDGGEAGHAEARREWIEALANAWLRIQGKDRDSAAQLINQAVDLLLGA